MSVCTRTSLNSRPNRDSMNARVAWSSGCPGSRSTSSTRVGTSQTTEDGLDPDRWSIPSAVARPVSHSPRAWLFSPQAHLRLTRPEGVGADALDCGGASRSLLTKPPRCELAAGDRVRCRGCIGALVFGSSSSVYGDATPAPFAED